MPSHFPPRTNGFTLIELIMVIAISGVIAAAVGQLVGSQMAGYQSLSERAALVQLAQNAIRRMERDIHRGLPYSARISNTNSVASAEIINVLDAGRYRQSAWLDATDVATAANPVTRNPVTNAVFVGNTLQLTMTSAVTLAQNDHVILSQDPVAIQQYKFLMTPYWVVTSNTAGTTVTLAPFNTGKSIIWSTLNTGGLTDAGHHAVSDTGPYDVDTQPSSGAALYKLIPSYLIRIHNTPLITSDVDSTGTSASSYGVSSSLCTLGTTASTFDIIGGIKSYGSPAACQAISNTRAVVHNLSDVTQSQQSAYLNWDYTTAQGNVALAQSYCPQSHAGDDTKDFQLTVTNANTTSHLCPFPTQSPGQRLYLVDSPVSFICANGKLTRYTGYTPDMTLANLTSAPTAAPAGATSVDVLTNQVSSCSFVLTQSTSSNVPALLTVRLGLTSATTNEQVSITQQISIENEI